MKSKKWFKVLVVLVLAFVFLFPFKGNIKDGGSVYYHPLIPTYQVVQWNGQVDDAERSTGTTVTILNLEVYNTFDVKV